MKKWFVINGLQQFGLFAVVLIGMLAALWGLNFLQPKVSASVSPLSTSGAIFFGSTGNNGVMRVKTFTSPATFNTTFSGISGSASQILFVSAKTAPTREEMMIGSERVNGTLQVESCTTACDANGDFTNRWSHASAGGTADCDNAPTINTCYKNFDIGYEGLNGKAMIVYAGDGADAGTTTDTDTVYYAEWNGSAWSPNATPGTPGVSNALNLAGTAGTPRWIRVIPQGDNLNKSRTNRLMMLVSDTNNDLIAHYWDGSSWDAGTAVFTTLTNCDRARCFDGAWSSPTQFVVAYTNSAAQEIRYQTYTVGTGWSGDAQAFTTNSVGAWISAVSDPTSSRAYFTMAAVDEDTRGAVWRADDATNGWTVCAGTNPNCPDTAIETIGGQQATTAFERFNGEALHVYNDAGTNAASVGKYYTYTPTSTWSTQQSAGYSSGDDPNAVLAWGNPNSDDIMTAAVDGDCDIDAQQWNGSSFDTLANNIETNSSMLGIACPAVDFNPTDGTAAWAYDFSWKMYTPWQRNWRFYDGSDLASTATTALAAENTAPTGVIDGQDLRLRINYADRGRSISNNDARKKLQYTTGCNPNSVLEVTCTWTDVDDVGGSGIWRYIDLTCTATDCADNTALTSTVLTGSSTCSAGLGCGTWVLDKDSATVTNMDMTAQSGADTVQEAEYDIEPNDAPGATYYFRLYNVDQDTPIYKEQDSSDCQPSGTTACSYPSVAVFNTQQRHYRWRNDNGSETTATNAQNEDTANTNVALNTNMRLRFMIYVNGGSASSYNYRLEYAQRSGPSCNGDENYTTMPDVPSTEPFDMVLTSNYADGTASTNASGVLTDPAGATFVAGKLVESTSNSSGSLSLTDGQFTEIEYAFQANSSALPGASYCFRLSNAGTPLTTYTRYPMLTITGTPTTDQLLRGGNWFDSNGIEQRLYWAGE